MKRARSLSLSIVALIISTPMIAMEKGESSQAPQDANEQTKKLKLTPEEEKEQLAAVLKLTMLTTKLAELKMHHDQVIM